MPHSLRKPLEHDSIDLYGSVDAQPARHSLPSKHKKPNEDFSFATRLATDSLVAGALFTLVLIIALILHVFVDYLTSTGVNPLIVGILTFAEVVLVTLDVTSLLWFLIKRTILRWK
jgi:hypothetical protein